MTARSAWKLLSCQGEKVLRFLNPVRFIHYESARSLGSVLKLYGRQRAEILI